MNGITVVGKLSICKVAFVHFWQRIHPKKLRMLQEMVPSFHKIQSSKKLEAFTVRFSNPWGNSVEHLGVESVFGTYSCLIVRDP
jgi:hypothetical protein